MIVFKFKNFIVPIRSVTKIEKYSNAVFDSECGAMNLQRFVFFVSPFGLCRSKNPRFYYIF